MKNYEISYENCTVTLSASFLRKASTLGTKEYNEMIQLRRDLPGFQFQKAEVEKKTASQYKNLTYKHMREYIAASFADEAEAKAMLDQMKKVESLSKIQANPYKYVHDWFIKQFTTFASHSELHSCIALAKYTACRCRKQGVGDECLPSILQPDAWYFLVHKYQENKS